MSETASASRAFLGFTVGLTAVVTYVRAVLCHKESGKGRARARTHRCARKAAADLVDAAAVLDPHRADVRLSGPRFDGIRRLDGLHHC